MSEDFDRKRAKKSLQIREENEREQREQKRLECLEKVIKLLRNEFAENEVQIFLVGSITRPYQFYDNSDIDIVVKGFTGDRFELWSKLERILDRNIEIIKYENCGFQDHIDTQGLKVV